METILMIRNRQGSVRSVDVANELGVSKSSVCTAMQNLLRGGYILMDRQRTITLTDSGEEIAKRVYERHLVFSEWLCALGWIGRRPCTMRVVWSTRSARRALPP